MNRGKISFHHSWDLLVFLSKFIHPPKENFFWNPTSVAIFMGLLKMFMLLSVGLNPGCKLELPKKFLEKIPKPGSSPDVLMSLPETDDLQFFKVPQMTITCSQSQTLLAYAITTAISKMNGKTRNYSNHIKMKNDGNRSNNYCLLRALYPNLVGSSLKPYEERMVIVTHWRDKKSECFQSHPRKEWWSPECSQAAWLQTCALNQFAGSTCPVHDPLSSPNPSFWPVYFDRAVPTYTTHC